VVTVEKIIAELKIGGYLDAAEYIGQQQFRKYSG